jgi:signal transduction histidine kinase
MTPRSHVFGYPVPAWQTWLMPALLSIVLVVVEQYSFLLFHLAAELFAVIVCFVLFSVAWSTYRFSKDAFLIFLACGFFWIGVLDLAHTLTYKGMNLFPMPGGNTATQIWIASRYFQALLLLASPFAARVQFDKTLLFFVFGLIAVLIMGCIATGNFPDAYIDGEGLTQFKIVSEMVISAIYALSMLALWYDRKNVSGDAVPYLLAAIVLAIGAELAFIFYIDVYDVSNMFGHILKFLSSWAILRAVVEVSLIKPYLQLAASNRAKDDFLASMSHDLRTPLNSILGFADMIRSHAFGPLGHAKYEEYVGNIHASGTLLLGLVNDILDLSKLESGQYQLSRTPLKPDELTRDVLRSFMPDIDAKKLKAQIDCPEDIGTFLGDERAMVQLLNNLLSNAVKFTPSGGTIAVVWSKSPDGTLTLEVRDSGQGIPEDKISKLAQPYVQVDPYLAQQKGTGLGLFIVRRIAELHGATFGIRSRLGAGTTVTIGFPATALA